MLPDGAFAPKPVTMPHNRVNQCITLLDAINREL